MQPQITAVDVPTNPRVQLARTVALIGKGIRAGCAYQPLRLHAAQVATTAPRKDYLGQLKAIYDDFLNRWRYVRDPVGIETVATSGPAVWGIVGGSYSPNGGKGWGDCDDATTFLGASAMAIGLPVRIVTMSPPGSLQQSHVYPEVFITGRGWITADPVAHPLPMGGVPPAGSRIYWDLHGRKIGGKKMYREVSGLGYVPAYPVSLSGLAGTARAGYSSKPLEVSGLAGIDGQMPVDFFEDTGKGAHVEVLGMVNGGACMAEVDPDTEDGYAMTPLMEVGILDYSYLQENGRPYPGMGAVDMDDNYYQWVETPDGLGFFKKLFRRVKKGIKRGWKKIKKVAKRIIKRLPGGKYLLKFGRKLKKIAMKLVRPLAKLVGKAAPFLAKVAAFIPGYGPAIAAGLHTAGKIANVMRKVGVTKKKGKLRFTSGQQMAKFKAALKAEARREAKRKKGRRRGRPRRAANAYMV